MLDVPMQGGVSGHFGPDWLACFSFLSSIPLANELIRQECLSIREAESTDSRGAARGSRLPSMHPFSCRLRSSCTRDPDCSLVKYQDQVQRQGTAGEEDARLNLLLNPSDVISRKSSLRIRSS